MADKNSSHPPSWRALNADTSPEVEALQFAAMRNMPAWRKLELMTSLNRTVHDLALSGLRTRHPEAGEAELKRLYAELALGAEILARLAPQLRPEISDCG